MGADTSVAQKVEAPPLKAIAARSKLAPTPGKPKYSVKIKNAKGEDRPGAFDLAQAIFAALYYGKVSAWLWWQGSENSGMTEFSLMQGTRVGKRYYASKQFYRYVRPGARMVRTASTT